jgi:hypothetical protein
MSEILSGIQQSDEVISYPMILELLRINCGQLCLEEIDPEKKNGFMLLGIWLDTIVDDMIACREIGAVSGLYDGCNRAEANNQSRAFWPKLGSTGLRRFC